MKENNWKYELYLTQTLSRENVKKRHCILIKGEIFTNNRSTLIEILEDIIHGEGKLFPMEIRDAEWNK